MYIYLAGQIGVSAELRSDVVGRGGVEVRSRVQADVTLAEAWPASSARARLSARQHCNIHTYKHYINKNITNR